MTTATVPRPPEVPTSTDVNMFPIITWARTLSAYLLRELQKRPQKEEAISSVMLISPNGSVYSVQVDDDGVLSTTLVLDNAP